MRFLARPVTGDYAHDHTGHSEEHDYEYDGLYHTNVPLVWPRYSAIAIALMNMPAMIPMMSMLPHVDAQVHAHCYHQDPEC